MTQNQTAHKWMLAGIKKAEGFETSFRRAKTLALDAGFFFLSARQSFEDGAWGEFLTGYTHKLSERRIRFFMQFATEAIEWVKHEQPQLTGMPKIQVKARAMVLQSPRGLVALCRELGLMRKFGEYDAVRYAERKGAAQQLELPFEKLMSTLDALDQCDSPNFDLQIPEGKTETQAWKELGAKLESALTKVRAQFAEANTIET